MVARSRGHEPHPDSDGKIRYMDGGQEALDDVMTWLGFKGPDVGATYGEIDPYLHALAREKRAIFKRALRTARGETKGR